MTIFQQVSRGHFYLKMNNGYKKAFYYRCDGDDSIRKGFYIIKKDNVYRSFNERSADKNLMDII
jgi:hypothetical protein